MGWEVLRAGALSDLMSLKEKIDRQSVKAAMAGKEFDAVLIQRHVEMGEM